LGSLFVIQFIPRPGHTLDEIQRVIDEELALLRQEPPKRQEIDRALNGLEAAHLQAIERASSKADQLNAYYMYTGNPDYFEEDLARYRAIAPEDVSSAVRRFLPTDRRVELSVMPEQEASR